MIDSYFTCSNYLTEVKVVCIHEQVHFLDTMRVVMCLIKTLLHREAQGTCKRITNILKYACILIF